VSTEAAKPLSTPDEFVTDLEVIGREAVGPSGLAKAHAVSPLEQPPDGRPTDSLPIRDTFVAVRAVGADILNSRAGFRRHGRRWPSIAGIEKVDDP